MKIVIHPDFMQTADFIKQLPQHFAQEGELLYEGRNEVRRYRVKNEWLVVKKYKQPNIIQRIVYTFFKKSKTERAYLFAGMLRKRGFDTPHEVAYIEKKRGGLFLDGYFISTQCDFPPLSKVLWQRRFDTCRKRVGRVHGAIARKRSITWRLKPDQHTLLHRQ